MESNVLQKRWVQGSNVVVDDLRGTMFTGENGAHTFQISGVDSAQETVEITGTITGRFLTATNVTVPLTGTVSGGVASLTLTEDCYVIPGRFVLSIYATNGSTTQCIYCAVGNVFRTQSDIIEYPSASIPDIEQIIANAQAAVTEINAEVTDAQAAVAAAQTAVDGIEAQRQTMIESIASVAGQGTDTTLSQSGVAADAKAAGDQISDLKSAFVNDEYTFGYSYDESVGGRILFDHETYVNGRLDNNGGVYADTDPHITTGFLRVRAGQILTLSSAITDYHHRIAEYNTDNVSGFIRNAPTSSETSFTVPDDVKYIRFSFPASELATAQLTTTAVLSPQLDEMGTFINSAEELLTYLDNALPQWVENLDNGKRILDYVWGNIAPSGAIDYGYTPKVRIVTSDYEKFSAETVLNVVSGYSCIFAQYNDDYSLKNRTVYSGPTTITCPANTYYRACIFHATVVPENIADFADKLWYASNISKSITEIAAAEAGRWTNGGYPLTTVSNLDLIGDNVMTADRTYGIYRYAGSATSVPSASSGAVHVFRAGAEYQAQLAMPVTGGAFFRYRNGGVWSAWKDMTADSHVYHVEKDGSGDFTSLVEAINTATQYMDSVVYVGAGEWDICDELGETYLNNVSATHGTRGPYLKNRIHLIFASNSKVLCNYTGTREDTMRWLSPFNAGEYGFTLENANIECSNCRYCVHDERDSDTDLYINKYINCRMYLNNSTQTVIRTCNTIGGGLGKNGYIEIDGCWFDAEPTSVYVSQLPLVTYHNSVGANAMSHISVKNCYLAGDGRFRFNWYGQSQLVTNVEVCGCSMGSSILSQAEVEGSSPYQNINVIDWNNTVRV